MRCASEGIWEWNLVTKKLSFDTRALEIFGYGLEEKEESDEWWLDRIHPDDRSEVKQQFLEYASGRRPDYSAEFRIRRNDESYVWIVTHGRIVEWDDKNQPMLVVGINREISRRKEMELACERAEERFRYAAMITSDLIYEWDVATGKIQWYGDLHAALGYEHGEFATGIDNWLNLIHPDDRIHLEEAIDFYRTSTQTIEGIYRIRHNDGSWRVWRDRATPILDSDGKPIRWVGSCNDITDLRRAEEALKESEGRNRRLIESLPDIVYVFSRKRGALYWSPRIKDILGYDEQDRRHNPFLWYHSIHEEDREKIEEMFDRDELRTSHGIEYRVRDNHGRWRWFRDRPVSITREGEDVILEGVATDITERKEAELELARSESRLRRAQQIAGIGNWEYDLESGSVFASDEARRIYGLDDREWTIDEIKVIPCREYREYLNKAVGALINRGTPLDAEYEIERASDARRVFVHSTAEYDSVRGVITGAIQDITGRKRGETALRKSEQKYRELMELAREGIWVVDAEGRTTHVNPSMAGMLGYDVTEIIGKPLIEFMHPDDRPDCESLLTGHLDTRHAHQDYEFQRKDESVLYATMAVAPLRDEQGSYLGAVVGVMDMTERRTLEQELEDKAKFNRLVSDISQSLVHAEPEELDKHINHALESIGRSTGSERAYIFQFRGDSFIGDNTHEWCADGIEPQAAHLQGIDFRRELPWIMQVLQREETLYLNDVAALPPEAALEKEHLLAQRIKSLIVAPMIMRNRLIGLIGFDAVNGCFQWSDNARSLLQETGMMISRSIEHVRAEVALRESQRSMAVLLANLPGMAYRCRLDDDLTMEYISPACEYYTGYTPDEIIEHRIISLDKLTHPDDRDYVHKTIRKHIDNNTPFEIEYRMYDRGGNLRWFWERGVAVPDRGNPISLEGFITDITERKEAENALRYSEAKYRSYVDHAPDGIFIVDREGSYIDVNDAACSLTGYKREELLCMTVFDLGLKPGCDTSLFSLLCETGVVSGEIQLKRKDGLLLWTSIDAACISDNRFIAFCSDVTETKRLREMEARAQRLETAGRVAGQVAHDFNNMLGPLMAYPGLMREELAPDSAMQDYLSAIEDAAHRMTEINQQLLSLGRRAHYNTEPLDLNDVVKAVLRETDSTSETLMMDVQLTEALMHVMGGGAQLHRVVSNLIQNALDAMKDIGTLTIRTENFYVDDVSVAYGRVPKGEYVKLTVSDTGCGIESDRIEHIFDPFYTSKTADKKRGSGLGLSVVDAVIRDHQGYIDLKSRTGEGTSFYIYLPVTRAAITSITDTAVCSGGSEKILVIDDDVVQRDVSRRLLTHLGYRVTTASSGEEGLEAVKREPVDLLVLDMIMPNGWDGAETYRRITELYPDQKAIIVSGYSETEYVHEAQRLGAGAFVRKPLTLVDLAAAVRLELDILREKGCPER